RPFITLMHLMKRTNGLSQTEFSLFGPTLINFQDIAQYSEYVLKRRTLRGSGEKEAFDREFLMNFYQTESLTDTQRSNPFEYGDNSMRYFRLTRYFKVTKETLGHWRISLEPSRRSEIEQLLEVYDGSAVEFKNVDGYVDYLSDIESPELPWERYTEKSKEVIASLIDIVKVNYSELVSSLQQEVSGKYHTLVDHEMTGFNSEQAATLIEELRSFRRKIIDLNRSRKLKRNLQELRNIITIFQDRSQMRNVEPVEFEYMISQCLKILNDEIEIIPNCIVDDEGNPIGFAPGNKPDIEGYYESFNSIFEATLDVSRNQVYRESMPVMRHLRDFEIINPDKPSFCVFISPRAHRDTVNYFWYSVRNGFEGRRQNIIALDLNHFIEILKFFIEVLESGNQFTHHDLRTLLESIVAKANNNKSSTNWFGMTSEFIEEWKSSKE
nr:AlwI family type II restriction endonuclease [Bacteroidota bacterium]